MTRNINARKDGVDGHNPVTIHNRECPDSFALGFLTVRSSSISSVAIWVSIPTPPKFVVIWALY